MNLVESLLDGLTVETLKSLGVHVESVAEHGNERHNVNEPLPISLTLRRGENTCVIKVYMPMEKWPKDTHGTKMTLTEQEYLPLIVTCALETETDALKRTWQYQSWGDPVHKLSPRLARPGYGGVCGNEFDYYHYDPGWMPRNVGKPLNAMKQRLCVFLYGE